MTVDDRLRAAHARIPEPDEATIARARALLDAAMATDQELRPHGGSPLSAAPPAGGPRPADPARLPGDGSPPVAARRRARPLRVALPLAALALAAVAAVAVLPRDVERVPAPPAKPAGGPVTYLRNTFHMSTRYIGANGRPTASPREAAYAISRSVPEEIWLAPDGSARVAYGKESAPYLPSPADERAWSAAGSPDLAKLMGRPGRWGPKRTNYGPGRFEAALLSTANLDVVLPEKDRLSVLPRKQWELREFLIRAARKQRPNGPGELRRDTFAIDALAFLQYPATPRDLRRALIQVLRNVPGGRDLGNIRDSAGREVRAFQLPADMEGGPVIAYDPRTSRMLARGAGSGDAIRWNMTYRVKVAGVAKIGERP